MAAPALIESIKLLAPDGGLAGVIPAPTGDLPEVVEWAGRFFVRQGETRRYREREPGGEPEVFPFTFSASPLPARGPC